MKYRTDKYGNQLSQLGYGCMRFTKKGTGIDYKKAEKEVLLAIQNGINYFDTAYTYPGMNRVLQAAGRVIRTETDKGAILLIDERFETNTYLPLFPKDYQDRIPVTLKNMPGILKDFWNRTDAK